VPRASSPLALLWLRITDYGLRVLLATALSIGAYLGIAGGAAFAEDWPTYQHDGRRSGVTSESLTLPLAEHWRRASPHPPCPAWPEPARIDYWHNLKDLAARVTDDRAFHVVAAGDAVFFGSSADDKVYCLDAATGGPRWAFYTGGPVRFAPAVSAGKVYAGSDDGWVYCLAASDGALAWKCRGGAGDHQVIGNGRLISRWPVRTGLLVEEGVAYLGAGLFPNEGVYLRALSAADGSTRWQHEAKLSPQGYLLAGSGRLFVPTGGTSPEAVRLSDGQPQGQFKGSGGSYALVIGDLLANGPGKTGQVELLRAETREAITSLSALRMVATEKAAYLQTPTELRALDLRRHLGLLAESHKLHARQKAIEQRLRQAKEGGEAQKLKGEYIDNLATLARMAKSFQACVLWKRLTTCSNSLVLAGEALFAGGDGEVAAFSSADGARLWGSQVTGRAYGLAVAQGRLFATTDKGVIHAFGRADASPTPSPTATPNPLSPLPQDGLTPLYARAAKEAIEKAGVAQGYCLVLGGGRGRLAGEIARESHLTVVDLEEDDVEAAGARRALDQAGLLGARVTVSRGPLSGLPSHFANLVVSEAALTSGRLPDSPAEILRVLRPCGGVAILGQSAAFAARGGKLERPALDAWLKQTGSAEWRTDEGDGLWASLRRGRLPGSGEWTHMYADPANTACSGEERVRDPMEVQWFGPPGPRPMIDRHHRAMPPLVKDGRLFVPAEDRVFAVDAYNGTLLWEAELPASTRLAAPKDSGFMAVADDLLYVADPKCCRALDVATGKETVRFPVPEALGAEASHWGYTAVVGDLLFGSGRKPDASLRKMGKIVIDIQYGDFKEISTSLSLFCLDRHSGKTQWTYKSGVILDPTLAVGGGRVYFVESANPEAAKDAHGRLKLDVLVGNGANLVALDAPTGRTIWKKPVDLRVAHHILFLSYAKETLIIQGSRNKDGEVWYDLFAFDARTGDPRWHREQDNKAKPGGDHGEQSKHPAIVGDVVHAEPFAYNLQTGEPLPGWSFDRKGHGCGTISASASALFYRAGNPAMFDLATRKATRLSDVSRPGCWINMIPAGGLVLIPEASSGCTCGFPIQTSIAFSPKE